MKFQVVLIIGLLSLSALAFQNCGEVAFGPNDDILLVEKAVGSNESEDIFDEVDLGESSVDDNMAENEADEEPIQIVDQQVDQVQPDEVVPDRGPNPPSSPRGPDTNVETREGSQDGLVYQCILEGPGNSKRLGVVEDLLFKNGRTPETVCMSRFACENLVSQKFKVKWAKKAGFCGANPHTIQLSDQRIQELLDQI